MKISLKPQHLKRYKDFALLFLKYGNSDLVRQFGIDEVLDEKEAALPPGAEYKPDQLTDELIEDYTTSRVLTMKYVTGKKITALGPLVGIELDGGALADEVFRAYLKQVLVDGLFHADPHPGNVYLTDDRRIPLLDLGMVGRVAGADPPWKDPSSARPGRPDARTRLQPDGGGPAARDRHDAAADPEESLPRPDPRLDAGDERLRRQPARPAEQDSRRRRPVRRSNQKTEITGKSGIGSS